MKVCPDTNVLVRAVVAAGGRAEQRQADRARACLGQADRVVLTLPALCEFVWVMRSAYRAPKSLVTELVRKMIGAANVDCDRSAVKAGLQVFASGGDFADGVIAHSGFLAGADFFASFDRKAVKAVTEMGGQAGEPG